MKQYLLENSFLCISEVEATAVIVISSVELQGQKLVIKHEYMKGRGEPWELV